MRHLIELSGESEALALAEALALGRNPEGMHELDSRALVMDSEILVGELVDRLALAWSVSQHAFSCHGTGLEANLEALELPGSTFRVRTSRLSGEHPPEAGASLTRQAGKVLSSGYRVDLENPDVLVIILMGEGLHVGLLCGDIDRPSLEARKPENRPFKHPISLHPKLARALVNLTGVRSGQTLLDPFCGTGGVLLEAGLMGCKTLGGDIDSRMVDGTLINLEHYGVAQHDIRRADVSDWPGIRGKVDAIATDPPYGRSASTARVPIKSLYARAFLSCHKILNDGGKLAMVLPGEEHVSLARGFELEGCYPVRVHRSLTRFFCVFRKSSRKIIT